MNTIKIIDMSLREPGQRKAASMSFKEKLEVARTLDRLKLDTIELPAIGTAKADQLSNKTIASMVSTALSAAVEIGCGMVEETWESIRTARHPQLNLLVPVSTVQMEYTCHKKAPAMLELIQDQVKLCRFFCENVEFSAVDATRAETDFLYEAVKTAIAAGANRVTLCDSAGIFLPDEFASFVTGLKENVSEMENVELYVQVSDEMGMGIACAAAALSAGANGVKCTAVPAGYPTLDQVATLVQKKGADMDIAASLKTTDLQRTISQLSRILAPVEESESSFKNVALGDVPGVTLDANDTISDVTAVVQQMGYDLSEEDNAKVYEAFLRVANKKHFVGTRELDAIIASTAMQVPSSYHIKNYVINSGNVITATANVLVEKDGEEIRGVGVGDGPIDAAFDAIEQIIGHHYELDDFQIQTVTEGKDAMGSALVKIRADGKVYSGSGISTDIIGASIRAYVSALNKIVYDEA